MQQKLAGVPTLELPSKATSLVTTAPVGEKERVAVAVIEAAIALTPDAINANWA